MEAVPKHTYLFKRPGSSSYYFRCKVPLDLLAVYAPRKEIKRSLKTSDFKEALSRVKLEALKQDQEFAEARRRLASQPIQELSETEIERLAALWLHEALAEDERIRLNGLGGDEAYALAKSQTEAVGGICFFSDHDALRTTPGLTEREYQKIKESLEIANAGFKAALSRGKTALIEDDVDDLLDREGILLDKASPSYRNLAYAILKACIRSNELKLKRHAGEVVETPAPPFDLAQRAKPTQAVSHQDDLPISVIFEKWRLERRPPAKTASDFGAQIRRFIELHGDLPITAITKAHVRDFKDTLLRLPARPPKGRQGLTVQQLLKMAETAPEMPRLSPRTVNEKALGALNAILNWAVANGYIDVNPATNIKAATGKTTTTSRLPYSVDDLNNIFRFPIFTENERPKAGGGDAAKWLPILALFTGARLEELGQILVSDIQEEQGISFIDMTTIEEGKSYKNLSSRRRVPIHPELIELGFLDYVKERQKARDQRLFPHLKAEGDKQTAGWSKWWGRYARQHGITDSRKVFHSFRHTVKDAFRENGVPEPLADALQGHAPRHVGGMYGSGYSLTVLADALQKLQFPGLNLEHLRPEK